MWRKRGSTRGTCRSSGTSLPEGRAGKGTHMTFAICENVGAVGREPEEVTIARVEIVIENVPDGASREEVVQRLFSAGVHLEEHAILTAESEWSEDVRRQRIHIRRCSWDNLR